MRAHEEAVAAAKARARQTADDEARYRDLVAAGAVSASAYDKVKAAAESARAELNAAEAQADVARNETSYAVLFADADGVVVETLAEPGQVVDAGQVVVRVAHAGRREAVIELPETLRPAIGSTGRATLYGSGLTGSAKLRQLSDAANRQTRTFEARYVLEGRLADAPLGSTISDPDLRRPLRPGAAGTDRRDLRSGQGSRRMAGRRGNASGHVACRANRRPQRRSGFGRRQTQGGRSRRCARCASAARRRARATGGSEVAPGAAVKGGTAAMSGFNLSALAVRERSVTLFLLVAISIAGVVAFLKLGRAEDPSFTIKQMTVVTAWPGATAKEMEELVAERLEKRMQELRWYDRTETFTRPGLAFTTVILLDSTPPADVPEQFYQARKKLGDEAPHLPRGVIGPMVNDEYSDVTFALYALKAKGEPHRHLVREAEVLRQRLLHVPGVKKVNIIGEQAERIFVEFSYDRLATLGVSPQDIFAALNSRNVMTPAGSIEAKGPQVFIRLDGAIDDLQEIRNTPVAAQGRTLKLSDIAEVKRGYEDPATFLIRNNGEPTLLLGVVMREGWNGLDLGKALEAEAAAINAEMPLGMSLSKVTDQSVNIRAAVDEFMVKFFVALGVVMLVSFLSMGWRVGIVVAAAVPLTLGRGIHRHGGHRQGLRPHYARLVDPGAGAAGRRCDHRHRDDGREDGGRLRPHPRGGLCVEPYRRAHARRDPGDRDRLHAERLRQVDRRRVHQQHVLDRRHRADRILDRRRRVHALPGREAAAEHREARGRARGDLRHAALQPLPPAAGLCDSPQMAGRGQRGRRVRRRGVGHGRGEEAVLSDFRSAGGAGRSADAVWHVHRADECRHRQGRGLAGQAAGSQDRYRLRRTGRAALLPRHGAGATRSLVREDRRIDAERRGARGAQAQTATGGGRRPGAGGSRAGYAAGVRPVLALPRGFPCDGARPGQAS